jgi:hypothetical protein
MSKKFLEIPSAGNRVGMLVNLDAIAYVNTTEDVAGKGSQATADVYFIGGGDPVPLVNEQASALLRALREGQ